MTFPSRPGVASGYLALPSDAGKHPAIIVIQDWWGLNDWVRGNADRFARQGYVALAVDLYRGKVASDETVAHELMRGLPEDRAIADLRAAIDYLASRKDVDPSRIGAIGWCMGGGYSLGLAVAEPRLKAAVINYGRLVTSEKAIEGIGAAILGNFGETDQGIPVADVKQFEQVLKAKGKQADIRIYPGVGHAFMNENNKGGYDRTAAEDAWRRIDSFFRQNLSPAASR